MKTDENLERYDEIKSKRQFGYSLTSEEDRIHINWLI